jgi:hypothetical protein
MDDFALMNNHDDASQGYSDPLRTRPIPLPSPERTIDPGDGTKLRGLHGRVILALQYCKHFSVTCVRETNGAPEVPFIPAEFFAVPSTTVRDAICNFKPTPTSMTVMQGFTQKARDARMRTLNEEYLRNRMREFEREEGSSRISEKSITPNYRNIIQTAVARGNQAFYHDPVVNFIWFSLQEVIPANNFYYLHWGRVQALLLVSYTVRMAIVFLQMTIEELGLGEDVERVMMRPGHYYAMRVGTNPLLSEGEVNYVSAANFIFKKFGLYQLTDSLESLLLYILPNPGLTRIMRLIGILNFGDNGNYVAKLTNERVREELDLVLHFHRQNLHRSYDEKYVAAKDFLTRHPQILTRVVNAEPIHPRRPNALMNFDSNFAEAFYTEYIELADKLARRRNNPSFTPESLSDPSDSESDSGYDSLPSLEFTCTPEVAERV